MSKRVLPLSKLQHDVLVLLAVHRNPESFVAGGTVINQDGPRYSADIDVFHDREEAVALTSRADTALLTQAGFATNWLRREPGIHAAAISRGDEKTRLEWVRDSDFRFFPAMKDDLFGYRLHVADLATNKALAAAGRREPRDVLDLLYIDKHHLALGAVVWAAVAKDPGYSPESLITEIRRNARYLADDYADLNLVTPVDAAYVCNQFRQNLQKAESFINSMPAGSEGCLFLKDGVPVLPEPSALGTYTRHTGRRRGHWPSSPEIGSLMLPQIVPGDSP